MQNGQINLHYNYELDELFLIKRGVLFGSWMLETFEGTSKPYKKFEELETSSTLLENSIMVTEI